MEIKTGDIVWLKSGGPAMTVQGRDMGGMYKCTYFDKDNNRGGGSFAAEALTTNEP